MLVKESLTEDQLNEKLNRVEEIVEVLVGLLSDQELTFLSDDSRDFKEELFELYSCNYPSLMSDEEIKESTKIIFKGFRDLFDKNTKEFLKRFLIAGLEKIIFVDENAYIFNTKMMSNIPLILKDPIPFTVHENYANRTIIFWITFVNFKFVKDWKINGAGIQMQLLARYHKSFFEYSLIGLVKLLINSRRLNKNDRYRFFIDLDNLLFPDGSWISNINCYERRSINSKAHFEKFHGYGRYMKVKFMAIAMFLIFLLVITREIFFP